METDVGNKYSEDDVLPFEYAAYNIFAPAVAPILHEKLGITPNTLTFVNGVLGGALIVYFILTKQYKLASIFLVIRQLFDVLDGYIARKYKLTSKLGAKMDLYSDRITFLFVNYGILFELWKRSKISAILYFLFLTIVGKLMKKKFTCIRKEYEICKDEKSRSDVLKLSRELSLMELVMIKAAILYSFSYYKK